MQIPITPSKDQLSAFVAGLRASSIVYWAIGNEPDPADDKPADASPDPVNEPELGFHYATWVTRYKARAIRLKNDLPNRKLAGRVGATSCFGKCANSGVNVFVDICAGLPGSTGRSSHLYQPITFCLWIDTVRARPRSSGPPTLGNTLITRAAP